MKSIGVTIIISVCLGIFIGLSPISSAIAEESLRDVIVVSRDDSRPTLLIVKPYTKELFTAQDQIIKEFYDLLVFDLSFSGAFNVFTAHDVPQADFVHRQDIERGNVIYENWRRLSVKEQMFDYVIKCEFVPRGEGQFEIDILVYDIVQGNCAIGSAYGRAPSAAYPRKYLRRVGHKVTAEIITTLSEGKIQPITETRIAYVNHNSVKRTQEIFLIDYDGWKGSIKQVTKHNSVTQFPDWSPDGDELAYLSYKKNDFPDSYIHNLPKGTISVLARYEGANITPRWCPDGQNLVISLSSTGNPEIYLIPRSGKNPKRLTKNKYRDISPDVSPSGDQIVYISDGIGSPQVYTMNINGSGNRRISYIKRKCESPFWSPIEIGDSLRIAFSGYYDNNQSDIFTIKPDGSDVQMITDGKSNNLNPSWSPNGRFIAFSSNRMGKSEIYLASSDPEQTLPGGKRFYRVTYTSGENLCPSWSPN